MEYLKIAQDLEMYGVSYFAITVSVDYCVLVCYCEKNVTLNITVMLVYIPVLH